MLEGRVLLAATNPLDLSMLDGTNGFRLDGNDTGDRSGFAVSSAGDVNGDGFDDLIIGADRADPGGDSSAGESYVVFGMSGGFGSAVDLGTLDGTTGFRLDGIDGNDRSGRAVSSAGDVNGDGFDDLIIGAFGAASLTGESYVVFGKSGGFSSAVDLGTLDGMTGFRLDGIVAGDRSGFAVSLAGDVNGDGFDDLIIGADRADPGGDSSAGESYVVFGKSGGFGSAVDLSTLDGTTGFRLDGIDADDRSGFVVSRAGDVNGDGIADLIIGAYGADPGGESSAGESYVVFGKSDGFGSAMDLGTLDGTTGFRLDGIDGDDRSGVAVSSAGDVNGDGFADLIIGAYGADSQAGESYVVFGKSGGFGSAVNLGTLDGTTGFRLDGVEAGDYSGVAVSDAGDVNGDGFDDLIIGAFLAAPGGDSFAGESYVVFGKSGSFSSAVELGTLDGTTGFRLDGIDAGDGSGRAVSGAGDVNGDGFADLVIGAYGADPGGDSGAGESYVVFGGNFTGGAETQVGDATANTLTATQGAGAIDILIGAQNNDTLISDGGADVLYGGAGNDDLTIISTAFQRVAGGNGSDTLRLAGSGFTLDLTTIADNTLSDIEVIDISGSGSNTLTLDFQEVLNISSTSNTLLVLQNADDTVNIGAGWTFTGFESINGRAFAVHTQGAATLQIAGQVSLGALDGTTGFRLDGIDAGDNSGLAVSSAGDVNGDGFDDLIIGAYGADPGGDSSAGESYVVFGMSGGFGSAVDLGTLDGTTGFRLDGINAGDRSGFAVSSAGDVNGDGFDDLIIGAFGADSLTGESYVVFGKSGGFSSAVDLGTLDGMTGFRLDGIDAEDRSGFAVSSAGDVNGDGFDDLIIGAYGADSGGDSAGESYVVFGKSGGFGSAVDLGTLDGMTGFRLDGINAGDYSGRAVSSAGDVNGDGFADLIIGALGAGPGGDSFAGESYVVFGKSDGFGSAVDLGTLDGTSGFRLDGTDGNDYSGRSVSSAGDVNGDGFDDLIVGAEGADPGGDSAAGKSYVVFGKSGGFSSALELSTLDGTTGFRLDGIDAGDNSGLAVSGAGDVNGDGFDDLIIGAFLADSGGDSASGESYVVFGKSGGFSSALELSTLDGTTGFRLSGIDAGDGSGRAVSSAGDVNGDGFTDLVIGANGADPGGDSGAGESYVVFGGNFTGGAETQVGDATANTLTATQGAGAIDILIGAQNNDTLISDGGADVLYGGAGNDDLTIISTAFQRVAGGSGSDTLRLAGSGLTLDLTTIADNTLSDIEVIDISGSGSNILTLDFQEVLNISSTSNTLLVLQNADDTVNIGAGWTFSGFESINGRAFAVHTQGAATLQIPGQVSPGALNGTTGFRLDGIDAGDNSGLAVSGAGDVNGDGFDDLIIGAYGADPGGNSSAGESYVVFGKSGGFASAVDLGALDGTTGFRLDGTDVDDRSGFAVSSAGDVNGDGFDDLIIGAFRADSLAGESYVVFGKSGGFGSVVDLSTLDGMTGFRLAGIDEGDLSGRAVSNAGDVNGDGFDDLIIGAYGADPGGDSFAGESYVVFGKSGGFDSVVNLSTLDGTTGFRLDGIDTGDRSGFAVSNAGDVNGDGFADLIIGAFRADSLAGESYVMFGKSGGFSSAVDLGTLDGTTGFRLDGLDAGDRSGGAVSNAGDVNGDGFDDLIIGAYSADSGGGAAAGESYVVFGKSGGFGSAVDLGTLDGTTGFRLDGINAGDYSGRAVSSAGDVNADGFDDLIIGADLANPGGDSAAGESYVVFGKSGGFGSAVDLSTLDGTTGFGLSGIDTGDGSGRAVSSAGDVNGDGFDDLVIGASLADPGSDSAAGESYVVFGGNFTGGAETQVGDATANTLTATQGAGAIDILIGAQNNDTLISDGGADVLYGGAGNDDLTIISTTFQRVAGGSGLDTLRLAGSGLTLDLSTIPDNTLNDIEVIDISGSGSNILTLDFREVLNISSTSNTLRLLQNADDTVNIGAGWTFTGFESINGRAFAVHTQGTATLQIAGQLSLGALDGTTSFRVDGIDAGDSSGRAVSSAGDVNGDGFDDIIIGADGADSSAGETYVVFGKSDGFSSAVDLGTLDGTTGFRLNGIDAGDGSGRAVSSAGDVNGDGFDDLIIGGFRADSLAGDSYVVFGKSGGFNASVDLATLDGTTGFRLDGIDAYDGSGRAVSSAGDVNGDGFDDLIVGAYVADPGGNSLAGESYVVFGKSGAFGSAVDLGTLDGTTGFRLDGIDVDDFSGFAVSDAGDVNGDGFDDLIIGAFLADPGGNPFAGESYVVFGKSGGFSSALDLGTLNGTTGFRVDGIDGNDRSGFVLSGAGDVNGDGFDDLIIGAYGADPGGDSAAGESYVVFGKSGGFGPAVGLGALDGTAGFRLDGIDADDRSGRAVSSAGDMNGDGFDDLIIGADRADPGGDSAAGESYVVFGKSDGFGSAVDLGTLDGTTGFRLDGIDAGDASGSAVSSAGDVNGDGFDDVIIGAFDADAGGDSFAGESYVVFGGNFTGGAETQVGDATANTLTATQGADAIDILIGAQNNDTLISDGGADVLYSGAGNDDLTIISTTFQRVAGGSGSDTLRLAGSGVTLDLTTIADNTLSDIEVIDISGSGSNTLTLDFQEVLNISSTSNTLLVLQNADDTVNIGAGWTQGTNQTIDTVVFEFFTQGVAVLGVQDVTPPTVIVDIVDASLNDGDDSSNVTFQFSEAVSNFDANDVTISGGVLAAFMMVDSDSFTATFTTNDGAETTGSVTVNSNSYTDTAGNNGATSNDTVAIDTLNPNVTVNIVDTSLNDSDNSSSVTFEFSDLVSSFDASDVSVTGGALSAFVAVDGDSFTATFTADDGVGTSGSVSVGTAYTDVIGNAGTVGSDNVTIDTLNPTVDVNIVDASLSDGDNSSSVTFEFSEEVTGFTVDDVTVSGGVLSAFTTVDSDSFTATFTASDGIETSGSVSVGSAYTDVIGNAGIAASDNVTIDTISPEVAVNIVDGSLNDGDNSSNVTFEFSEVVSNFDASDVSVAGGTLSAFAAVDGDSFTATFTADNGVETTGSVSVGAAYTDTAGNNGAAANDTVAIDTMNPNVTVNIVDASLDDSDNSSSVTFEFSELVSSFDASDVSVTGGALSAFTAVDGDSFTATFTADDGVETSGSVTVGTAYTDVIGNAGTVGSDNVTIDTLNPTVDVNIVDASLSDGDNSSSVTFEFSEAVTGFTADDVTVSGGVLSAFKTVDIDSFTATFTASDGIETPGSVSVGSAYTDVIGNAGMAGSDIVTIDTISPEVAVNIVDASLNDGDNSSNVTFEFSEVVSNFDASDVSVAGGTLSAFAAVDGDSFTATFTADNGVETTGSVSVGAVYTDTAGNNGAAGSDTVAIDTIDAPSLSIAATNATKREGDADTTPFIFTVTRNGDTGGSTTVDYVVTGSGANPANAADFDGGSLPTGTVTFTDGQASKVISVDVSGDSEVEPDDGFTVTLSNASGEGTISTATAAGIIQNDDDPDAPTQIVSAERAELSALPGGTVSFDLKYDASDADSTLSGLSFSLHFDSSKLSWVAATNLLDNGFDIASAGSPQADSSDLDGNAATDSFVLFNFLDNDLQFPGGSLPATLATITFNVSESLDSATPVTFSEFETAATDDQQSFYQFESVGTTVSPSVVNLDVDDDGRVRANTDGLTILRYLLGQRGEDLARTVFLGGNRTDPAEIAAFLDAGLGTMLDVDDDGRARANTDGLTILRYMLGQDNTDLVRTIFLGGERTDAADVRSHLESFDPTVTAVSSATTAARPSPVEIRTEPTVNRLQFRLPFSQTGTTSDLETADLLKDDPPNALEPTSVEAAPIAPLQEEDDSSFSAEIDAVLSDNEWLYQI